MSAAYSIVRKRNLTLHRVKKTAQAWKIISFAGIIKDIVKSVIVTLSKFIITALFFIYIFGKVDFHQFADTMRGARIELLAGALLATFFCHFLCVLRWRFLIRPLMRAPTFMRLCGIYCIGLFFNLTFPTTIGGDVVKVYYAGKPSRAYAESFASMFLDRDIGMLAMMIIACCAVFIHPVSVPGVSIPLILWSVFILFIIGNIAVFTPQFHRILIKIMQRPRLEKIAAKIDNVAKAFRIIGKYPAALWMSLGLSFANQTMGCVAVWIIALSIGIRIPMFYFLIFVPVVTLISMIPVSLNGMGLREYSFMNLFGAIGVAGESCIALGLLFSFMVILSSLPGGLVYIFFRGKAGMVKMASIETAMEDI